jgi:hypothetical protein
MEVNQGKIQRGLGYEIHGRYREIHRRDNEIRKDPEKCPLINPSSQIIYSWQNNIWYSFGVNSRPVRPKMHFD